VKAKSCTFLTDISAHADCSVALSDSVPQPAWVYAGNLCCVARDNMGTCLINGFYAGGLRLKATYCVKKMTTSFEIPEAVNSTIPA
jgi:hypothetical protein